MYLMPGRICVGNRCKVDKEKKRFVMCQIALLFAIGDDCG